MVVGGPHHLQHQQQPLTFVQADKTSAAAGQHKPATAAFKSFHAAADGGSGIKEVATAAAATDFKSLGIQIQVRINNKQELLEEAYWALAVNLTLWFIAHNCR